LGFFTLPHPSTTPPIGATVATAADLYTPGSSAAAKKQAQDWLEKMLDA